MRSHYYVHVINYSYTKFILLNALPYHVDPSAQIINLIPIQLNIPMTISGHDLLSKMATMMLDIEYQ